MIADILKKNKNSFVAPTKEDIEQAKIVFIVAELRNEHPHLSELELHDEASSLIAEAKDMADKAYNQVKDLRLN